MAGAHLMGSILILQDQVTVWPVASLERLSPEAFDPVLAVREDVEFILLGAGETVSPPPRNVREALKAAGMGLELMSTKEAVRLYNVLAAEGRRIAAALIAID